MPESTLRRSAAAARFVPALLMIGLLSVLGACSDGTKGIESTTSSPEGRHVPDIDDPNRQTIFGSGGVNDLFEPSGDSGGGGGGLGVNAFLWRATLDTFAFLPLFTADPLGGIVNYDWYASPETPNERFKVQVFILDTRLRADALTIKTFRELRGADGTWYAAPTDPATNAALEDAVLTRARQIRIAQLGQ